MFVLISVRCCVSACSTTATRLSSEKYDTSTATIAPTMATRSPTETSLLTCHFLRSSCCADIAISLFVVVAEKSFDVNPSHPFEDQIRIRRRTDRAQLVGNAANPSREQLLHH